MKLLRSRGYLPHLEDRKAIYFVTFRLADSLPEKLTTELRREKEAIEKAGIAGNTANGDVGRCDMRDSRVAQIVADAIRHFHGSRYELFAWCVMPNHVHVLFSPMGEHTLGSILHSWKSYSALEVNRVVARTGRFWQREYFDHLVRSEGAFRKFLAYIRDNPKRAGLREWPWVEVL